MKCPSCSSTDIQSRGKRNALYPLGIVAIIGLPFAMLHQASAPQEYHCDACGLDFAHRTTTARITRVLLFVFGIGFALLIITVIVAFIAAQSS